MSATTPELDRALGAITLASYVAQDHAAHEVARVLAIALLGETFPGSPTPEALREFAAQWWVEYRDCADLVLRKQVAALSEGVSRG